MLAFRPSAEAVLAKPRRCRGEGERDYGAYEISEKVPELAIVRTRAVWLEVVKDVRGNPTALMERLEALTDPERVEDASMLAG